MSEPSISVIIPAWNAAAHLPEALDSISAQGVPELEVIVVDDGSADETAAVAAAHRLNPRVLRRENGGPPAARNQGIAAARAPWIAFLDADDVWPMGSLLNRMEALTRNPSARLVVGRTRFEGCEARPVPPLPWTSPNLGSGLYRREVFEQVGLFECSLRYLDDVDWFWRVREAGLACVLLEEVTLHYRRHGAGLTSGKNWKEMGLPQVIQRSLGRRREKGPAAHTPLFALGEDPATAQP